VKKTAAMALVMLLLVSLASAWARDRDPQSKSVSGQVTDGAGKPIPEAIVHLKNMKSLAVKTFIAEQDGSYQFHGLSPNVDYDLYAEFNGARSDNKTVSQFDSKTNLTIHLKIKK
jgi:hypothetical protein